MSVPKWMWNNTTQVVFGEGCVKEHIKDFIQPKWKVLCTFGGGSIDKNGARKDVQEALDELQCEVRWEGGIPPNPEYERLVEILKVAREFKPDILLAVGGGSIIDGTKFIRAAMGIPEDIDPWELTNHRLNPQPTVKLGTVLTIPATGSEWNFGAVVSKRATKEKKSVMYPINYPLFSLLDPRYTMTLPLRQIRNGLYDAMCHCIDQVITPASVPMMDNFFFSVMRELVDIGEKLIKPDASIELHARLIQAASFALNFIFTLGKDTCWGIHTIGHQLTAMYEIDHGATLAIVTPHFLKTFVKEREFTMARAAERVFKIHEGSDAEKAKKFIEKISEWIIKIGQPTKVSEWKGAEIKPGDVEKVTKMVMESTGNAPFGYHGSVTEPIVKAILEKSIQ